MKNYHIALFIMSALITNNVIADEIEEVVEDIQKDTEDNKDSE